MNETPAVELDREAFAQVWRRVMPQDRPDCPFTLDPPVPTLAQPPLPPAPAAPQPAAQPLCLGEASAPALPDLLEFWTQAVACGQIYRALAKRWRGSLARREALLPDLARLKDRQAGRLSAAYFLISGELPTPSPVPLPRPGALLPALRERYQAEQRAALALFSAAHAASDPCLIELYRDLGTQDQTCAGRIRTWLEG